MASFGPRSDTFLPCRLTSPVSGLYTPERILMSVDLPAPFSPTTARTSPANRDRLTSCSACTPGNVFEMCAISRIFSLSATYGLPAFASSEGHRVVDLRVVRLGSRRIVSERDSLLLIWEMRSSMARSTSSLMG